MESLGPISEAVAALFLVAGVIWSAAVNAQKLKGVIDGLRRLDEKITQHIADDARQLAEIRKENVERTDRLFEMFSNTVKASFDHSDANIRNIVAAFREQSEGAKQRMIEEVRLLTNQFEQYRKEQNARQDERDAKIEEISETVAVLVDRSSSRTNGTRRPAVGRS